MADADAQKTRFSALLLKHQGIVRKVAATYAWDPDDQNDLAQDIATQLWRSYKTFDDSKVFSTWMYRVALNVAISWVRRHSLKQRYVTPIGNNINDVPSPPEHSSDDRVATLHAFINSLDPLNRALLLLYLEEHSHQTIADILGISKSNVGTKINRLTRRAKHFFAKGNQHGTE